MSQKQKAIRSVVPPIKKKKNKSKTNIDIGNIIIPESLNEQEGNEPSIEEDEKPKMKRLKKVKNDNQSDDPQVFIEKEQSEEVQFKDDEEKFERFHIADDDDIKKQEEEKKMKKNKKMKGLQPLDKFMTVGESTPREPKIKISKKQPESLNSLMQASKSKKQRKNSFDAMLQRMDCQSGDNEIDQIEEKRRTILAYQALNQEKDTQRKEQPHYVSNNVQDKQANNQTQMVAEEDHYPFAGESFFLIGQFQPYSNNQLMEVLSKYGGTFHKSINRTTSYAVQGSYGFDRWKKKVHVHQMNQTKQAQRKGIKIMAKKELEEMFEARVQKKLQQQMPKSRKINIQNYQMIDIEKEPSKKQPIREVHHQIRQQSIPSKQREVPVIQRKCQNFENSFIPWNQKHKPKKLTEIIGQVVQIKNLKEWMQAWQDIHIRGRKREVKGSFKSGGNINSKAALLSGDAGLGKTTTARLIATEYNFEVVQFNASDIRNKKSIQMLENKDNHNLSFDKKMKKTLVIMDEVDGMSTGDRGGIAAIISFIKKSRVPVICICNDRDSQKIRSLANHCYDIKFYKPDRSLIVRRLTKIIQSQGGTSNDKGLERIIELLQGDIRQILSYVEMFFRTVSKTITYDSVEKSSAKSKDLSLMMNHFEACKKLMNKFTSNKMKVQEKVDLGFVDSDFVPLMCQQNYLTSCPKKVNFKKLVQATQSLVLGDVINRKVKKNQNYVLMPNVMFCECVYPTEKVSQTLQYPKFTSWLGKFSSQRKNKRLIKELTSALCTKTLTSFSTTKYSLSPVIFSEIVNNLKGNTEVQRIIRFMDNYNITANHLGDNLLGVQFGQAQNWLKDVPASTKAKLTKAYNKIHQTVKFKKQKNKQEEGVKFDPVLEQFENLRIEDDSEMEEEEVVQVKKKKKK